MTNQKSARIYELDLLRFLAALAVVFFHYSFAIPNLIGKPSELSYPFIESVFKYGNFGVQFFFMISGFVILLTALKKDWQGFIISRVTRLYPAFWIAVTISTLAILLFSSNNIELSQYLWNLTMVPEYAGQQNIDAVYWTLQVEIKFYFWVFVILIFNKFRYLDGIILAWLMLSILSRFHLKYDYSHYVLLPNWAPYFSAGALFYLIRTQGLTRVRMALLMLSYILSVYYGVKQGEQEMFGTRFSPYVITLIITGYFVIFTLIIRKKRINRDYRWFAILGGISYPLYLLHGKIGAIIFDHLSSDVNKYLLFFLITAFSILVSYLMYQYLEKRLATVVKDKLKAFFTLLFAEKRTNKINPAHLAVETHTKKQIPN